MKKKYTKPIFVFENFSLNTSIAGDCGVKTNLPSSDICGMNFTGVGNVFLSGMEGCSDFGVSVDGEFNGICYHVPTNDKQLFNS